MFTEARGVFRVLCYATSQPISSNAGGLFFTLYVKNEGWE